MVTASEQRELDRRERQYRDEDFTQTTYAEVHDLLQRSRHAAAAAAAAAAAH